MSGDNRYTAVQDNFSKIPGSPVAYWVSENFIKSFENITLKDIIHPKQGTSTGADHIFVRFWYEINYIAFSPYQTSLEVALNSGFMYFPLNKGSKVSSSMKWYGSNEKVIKMNKSAYEELLTIGNHLPSRNLYFKPGITWSKISGAETSFRYNDYGFVFSSVGLKGFPAEQNRWYILALLNSVLISLFLQVITPGLSTVTGDIEKIPVIFTKNTEQFYEIDNIASSSVQIAKSDWDSFETSWDFERHPLI